AGRAMAEVIVQIAMATDRTIKCLRTMDPGFHEHTVEVNRLENSADNLLRDSLAALFEESSDPIEVIKWKEIYETMETVTDRCEDVANVIEGIILKMSLAVRALHRRLHRPGRADLRLHQRLSRRGQLHRHRGVHPGADAAAGGGVGGLLQLRGGLRLRRPRGQHGGQGRG